MKRCKSCAQTKPLEDFNKMTRSNDGRQSTCRACASEKQKEHRRLNPEIAALDHMRMNLGKARRWLADYGTATHEESLALDRVFEKAFAEVARRKAAAPRR